MTREPVERKYKHCCKAIDRHGHLRWRFRRNGYSKYLSATYGSAEFDRQYMECMEASKDPQAAKRAQGNPTPHNAPHGSVKHVAMDYLSSIHFIDLADRGKPAIRNAIEFIVKEAGEYPVAKCEVRHVELLMGLKSGPAAANAVRKYMSILFKHAARMGLVEPGFNPAKYAKSRKVNDSGYYTASQEDIDAYLRHHVKGTMARRAFMIFWRTGAALQDAAALGWKNVDGGHIVYTRHKTGVAARIKITPDLWEELELVPKDQETFLQKASLPFTPPQLGKFFKQACVNAGLLYLTAHGLRKRLAVDIIEHGGTPHEVMAILAHSDPQMGFIYAAKVNRGILGDRGMDRIIQGGTSPNREGWATGAAESR